MNSVFYQYYRENNILDGLIQEFAKRNWLFDKMPYDYFHQYRWPDIVLSDKEHHFLWHENKSQQEIEKEFPYTIELLGCYQSVNSAEKEGLVILYMPKIRETAHEFLKENGMSKNELPIYNELLTTLIMIHEFTHWIFHAIPFTLSNNLPKQIDAFKYNDQDSVSYHETLAQIFTNYFSLKSPELNRLFKWLENKQPSVYRNYRLLISDKLDEYINVSEDTIQRVIFSVMFTGEKFEDKNQSYTTLKEVYDRFITVDISEFYSNPVGFHAKYRSVKPGMKFGI